jgi:hypothetical protein
VSEWDFSPDTERFLKLQTDGKCGNRQNNGKRCTNPIVEYFEVDPDRPGRYKIGACGVHLKDVQRDLARVQKDRWQRSLRDYEAWQRRRYMFALNRAGIYVKFEGYRQESMTIEAPGDLAARLLRLGVIDNFDMAGQCAEGKHVQPCGPKERSQQEQYWDQGSCACGCKLYRPGQRVPEEETCWYVKPPDPPAFEVVGGGVLQ